MASKTRDSLHSLLVPVGELGNTLPFSVSIDNAAKLLGTSRPTIYKLIEAGNFPCCYKVGERTLVSTELLRAWVLEQCGSGVDA